MKLALTAPLRAGKSQAAGYLSLYYDIHTFAFSDELKDVFHRAFPHIPRDPKPRKLYQEFGEWAREAFGENVWVDACMAKVDAYTAIFSRKCDCGLAPSLKNRVLIEDVRQQNEYDRLRAEGFTIVRITAPEELRIERARKAGDDFDLVALDHPTEKALLTFEVDYEIMNDGTYEQLYAKLDELMAEVGVR
ncbi:dephospho-CoA kinase [Bacillus velezensis]|uniref:deoxynucleotide monophosphate kinase family protein n=1 Tax=Bacillus velezensis TaxID=492670 RepID=UPI0009F1FCED|nr:dephospho-CoA kinase [Bacillus velezensis]OQV53373.1 dephospho-CoA kinase [Bacillus velezensis]OQV55396.1 dephospho-CoA kinase [Bacillus velezensis]OQV60887.1 dephospho-CoA kinase [Bacillus velezensis]OQV61954.1 dephospho-CoA kinase [Bacillus velezensis]